MWPVLRSRQSGLPSLPSTTYFCTLPVKPWRTSHEPRADSRRVQRQDSLIGENLVRSSMGPVRTTDSRLRVPDVKTCIDRGPELSVLLRDRANGHHSIRLGS